MPELDDGSRFLARAYAELSTHAINGLGRGPIPWGWMVFWFQHHDTERDVADFGITVLRMVDAEFLRREAAKGKNPPVEARGKRDE